MRKPAGHAADQFCASSVDVQVTKQAIGARHFGFAALASTLWLIIATGSGSGTSAPAVFLVFLLASVPVRLVLRHKSIDRIETAVNRSLAHDLHTHVCINRKQAERLHDHFGTKIEDGNQSYRFTAQDPKHGTASGNAIKTDFVVTITALHGDLGLSAYQDMVRSVLGSQRI